MLSEWFGDCLVKSPLLSVVGDLEETRKQPIDRGVLIWTGWGECEIVEFKNIY